MKNKDRSNLFVKAFTLVEIIVVIAIISVLAAILVPSMINYMERAYNSADCTTGKVLCEAIQSECAMNPEKLYSFTKNPWGGGTNADGSTYTADDHGYIYVTHNEVRVSSYSIAKLLEDNGYIKDAGDFKGEIVQYTYKGDQCDRRMFCKSNRTWYRYQINIAERNGTIYFTYSANAKATQTANTSGQSSGSNLHDDVASRAFAAYIGGEADTVVSLPKD